MSEKYNKFKNIVISRSNSPFNPVFWVRSKYCDYIMCGIRGDIIYKIITPTDNKKKIISYWENMQGFLPIKKKLILIYPDKDFTKIVKEEEIQI